MKRILICLVVALLSLGAVQAQNTQRQKAIHMAAVRLSEQLEITAADKDAFIQLYQSYKRESADIAATKPAASENPEAAAEAKILCDFDKSTRLLDLRRRYYDKFRTVLQPTQIQRMYDIEREWAMKSGS